MIIRAALLKALGPEITVPIKHHSLYLLEKKCGELERIN